MLVLYDGGMKKRKRVDTHVADGDLFGTYATLLSLMEQDWTSGNLDDQYRLWLKLWVEDLVYLQECYEIKRK